MLEFRPSPEFRYDAGKNKLINLGLFAASGSDASFVVPGSNDSYDVYSDSNDIGYTDRVGKLLRLSTWIDMDSCITVGCAGALLTYIRRRKAVEQFPGDEDVSTCFRISAIEMFSLRDTMSGLHVRFPLALFLTFVQVRQCRHVIVVADSTS